MTEHISATAKQLRSREAKLAQHYEDVLERLQQARTEQHLLLRRLRSTQQRLDKKVVCIQRLEVHVQQTQAQLTALRALGDPMEQTIPDTVSPLAEAFQHSVQQEWVVTEAAINQLLLCVQEVAEIAAVNVRTAMERVHYAEMRLEIQSSGRYLADAYEQDLVAVQHAQAFVHDIARFLWTIEEHAAASHNGGFWEALNSIDLLEQRACEIYKIVQQVDSMLDLVYTAIASSTLTDACAKHALCSAQIAVRHAYAALRGSEMFIVNLLYSSSPLFDRHDGQY
ncbi:hypothetical protein ccbrp13_52080 [Ktedonobacteria bacterium brp13]|nr:hypothetical protein ccbrp13_52080 [Ktedonobacteria bacterium brp13]